MSLTRGAPLVGVKQNGSLCQLLPTQGTPRYMRHASSPEPQAAGETRVSKRFSIRLVLIVGTMGVLVGFLPPWGSGRDYS